MIEIDSRFVNAKGEGAFHKNMYQNIRKKVSSLSLNWNAFNLREYLLVLKKKVKRSFLEKRGKWSSIEFIFSWTVWDCVVDLIHHHHGKPWEVLSTWMLFSTAIMIRKFISIYHCSWKHRLWSIVSNFFFNIKKIKFRTAHGLPLFLECFHLEWFLRCFFYDLYP